MSVCAVLHYCVCFCNMHNARFGVCISHKFNCNRNCNRNHVTSKCPEVTRNLLRMFIDIFINRLYMCEVEDIKVKRNFI